MKYQYSRFKSDILYCALQKSIYRPGLEIFERAQVHKGLGWQRPGTWGSLAA
jgi:hypothetical protein